MITKFVASHIGYHVEVSVFKSFGNDGALVVQIDTDFEPDGSDRGPGLRVLVNDWDAYIGKPFVPHTGGDDEREA